METLKVKFSHAIRPAIIISIVYVVIALLLWSFIGDIEKRSSYGLITWIFVVLLYFYYARDIRNNIFGSYISYGQSFKLMMMFSLILSVFSTLFMYFQLTVLDPDIINQIKELAVRKLQEASFSAEQIEKVMEAQAFVYKPLFMTLSAFVNTIIYGLLISLIVSIFIRREEKIIEE